MESATIPVAKRRITIDPVTRLEGHGKIEIFLDEQGRGGPRLFPGAGTAGLREVRAGASGRETCRRSPRASAASAPPRITWHPPRRSTISTRWSRRRAARKIRELVYSTFMVEDHALHFYFLGGPDFVVGPKAPAAERNVLGVIAKVGVETGQKVIAMRRKLRELMALAAGKADPPGVRRARRRIQAAHARGRGAVPQVAAEAVEFAQFTLGRIREGGAGQLASTWT